MQGRAHRPHSFFVCFVIALLGFACFPVPTQANDTRINALWVAASSGVIQVATADGSIRLVIEDA
ncbi:MAG: hypothetical protein KZQ99_13775, partial [Candidatus Thiodiazotropha sp. (ex Dulcina madagascariensis)]|nr:hypothetical protein [Candidatus Thiodiazotropha sp. (ex Dulcina madagascariensis)]